MRPAPFAYTGDAVSFGILLAIVLTICWRWASSLFCHKTSNKTPRPGSVFSWPEVIASLIVSLTSWESDPCILYIMAWRKFNELIFIASVSFALKSMLCLVFVHAVRFIPIFVASRQVCYNSFMLIGKNKEWKACQNSLRSLGWGDLAQV